MEKANTNRRRPDRPATFWPMYKGQIEELSGQLGGVLTDQSSYSTLTVVFVVPILPTPKPEPHTHAFALSHRNAGRLERRRPGGSGGRRPRRGRRVRRDGPDLGRHPGAPDRTCVRSAAGPARIRGAQVRAVSQATVALHCGPAGDVRPARMAGSGRGRPRAAGLRHAAFRHAALGRARMPIPRRLPRSDRSKRGGRRRDDRPSGDGRALFPRPTRRAGGRPGQPRVAVLRSTSWTASRSRLSVSASTASGPR